MDETPLSDILTSEPDEAPAGAPPAEQSGQPRDEHGRFAPASETGDGQPPADDAAPADPAAPPAAPQNEDAGHIPVAALRDERQRRQQLEQQLEQALGYIQSLQTPQQPQHQPEAPDPNVDFAGWLNWRDQQIASQIRDAIMGEVQQYGSQVTVQNRAQVSEALARQRHDDYDKVIDGPFKEAIAANPMLVEHLKQAPDPAMFAYNAGKQYDQARQFGSTAPVSREQIEAEIRQQIMTELGMSGSPKAPISLASERSVGSRSGPTWSGPAELGDILS